MEDPERSDGLGFSATQRQRLAELSVHEPVQQPVFRTAAERDQGFEVLHRALVNENCERLARLREVARRPAVRRVEAALVEALTAHGFVEVVTPVLMGRGSLAKMGLGPDHPLWRQVYWVDRTRCLRPMLAPNLYQVLSHLQRLWPLPVRIFEVGPCFRKESKGSSHASEFTMLNLVELGPESVPVGRLEDLAGLVMDAVGLSYELQFAESEVYGATMDVRVDDLEVASGVAGPHPLDAAWGIADPWAGWGFGLERLAMVKEGSPQIGRYARSVVYLDGARLNVQAGRGGAGGAAAEPGPRPGNGGLAEERGSDRRMSR